MQIPNSLFPKSKAEINREKFAAMVKGPRGDSFRKMVARSHEQRRPRVGSQEWAETRGDDVGLSPDY